MYGMQPRVSKSSSELSSTDRKMLLKRLNMDPEVEICDSHAVLSHTRAWKGKQKLFLHHVGNESQSIQKKAHTTVINKFKKTTEKASNCKHENEIKNGSNRPEENLCHQNRQAKRQVVSQTCCSKRRPKPQHKPFELFPPISSTTKSYNLHPAFDISELGSSPNYISVTRDYKNERYCRMTAGVCICNDDRLASKNSNAGKIHKQKNCRPKDNIAPTLPEITEAGESLCFLKVNKNQGLEMRLKKLKIMKIKEEAWRCNQIGNKEASFSKRP